MTERDQLIQLCRALGSDEQQATVMADQLIKRCDQMATQRQISREEAMAHLLNLLIKGRQGETIPGFEGVDRSDEKQSLP